MWRILLALIVLLSPLTVIAQDWDAPAERPLEHGRWLCWSYSGKGAWALEIKQARPLDYFTRELADFDSEIRWRINNEPSGGWPQLRAQVREVGDFAGHSVVDVLFHLPERESPIAMLVLLGKAQQYRPVVWILDDSGLMLTGSQILKVERETVLSVRTRVAGSGNFYLEDYLIFDPQLQIPLNLRADSVIAAARDAALPAGSGIWKGGGFSLADLRYVSEVWKAGDANCCPSGGVLQIQLQLKDRKLGVRNVEFKP